MPQLVKGGKHVFGWSKVDKMGKIPIPPEAWIEYDYHIDDEVILVSGSKKSGGFSIIRLQIFLKSPLSNTPIDDSRYSKKQFPRNEIFHHHNRYLFITKLVANNEINLGVGVLDEYDVEVDTNLLAVRGSGLGLGLISKGPIYEEAKKHRDLPLYL